MDLRFLDRKVSGYACNVANIMAIQSNSRHETEMSGTSDIGLPTCLL